MYEQRFGMNSNPFRRDLEGSDIFVGPQQARVISNLQKALAGADNVVTVSGPAGVGKTAIVTRALETNDAHQMVAWIGRMRLGPDDLLELLLAGFGLTKLPKGTVQRFTAFRRILAKRAAENIRIVVVIEDALRVGNDALLELEALTAAESGCVDGANIILMGPPEIDKRINFPELARLRQRSRMGQKIQPFTAAEVQGYLKHCLRTAGANYEDIFKDDATAMIYRCSEGIPRVINNICDASLSAVHDANDSSVTRERVKTVAAEVYGLEPLLDEPDPVPPLPAVSPLSAPLDDTDSAVTAETDAGIEKTEAVVEPISSQEEPDIVSSMRPQSDDEQERDERLGEDDAPAHDGSDDAPGENHRDTNVSLLKLDRSDLHYIATPQAEGATEDAANEIGNDEDDDTEIALPVIDESELADSIASAVEDDSGAGDAGSPEAELSADRQPIDEAVPEPSDETQPTGAGALKDGDATDIARTLGTEEAAEEPEDDRLIADTGMHIPAQFKVDPEFDIAASRPPDWEAKPDAGESDETDTEDLPTLSTSMRVQIANDATADDAESEPSPAEPADAAADAKPVPDLEALQAAISAARGGGSETPEPEPEPQAVDTKPPPNAAIDFVPETAEIQPPVAEPEPQAADTKPPPDAAIDLVPETAEVQPPEPEPEPQAVDTKPPPDAAIDLVPETDSATNPAPPAPALQLEDDLSLAAAEVDEDVLSLALEAAFDDLDGGTVDAESAPDEKAKESRSDFDLPEITLDQTLNNQRKETLKLDTMATELANANSLEDISDTMAETLFGAEMDQISEEIMAEKAAAGSIPEKENPGKESPAAEPAVADSVPAEITIEDTAGTAGSAAEPDPAEIPPAPPAGPSTSELLSAAAAKQSAAEKGEGAGPPDPIEDQIQTSITQTLKALNVASAEDKKNEERKSAGLLGRIKKSFKG